MRRHLDDPIAFVRTALPALGGVLGTISVKCFIAHVQSLASNLPSDKKFALNLCQNRYLFLVAFCAVQVKAQSNLLPPNKTIATQCSLADRYDGVYVVHDGVDVGPSIDDVDVNKLVLSSTYTEVLRDIPLDFLSAITFTSGSTGESSPSLKYWQTFVESCEINAQYMLPDGEGVFYMLATVPGQHMWGMETSILLPLMYRVCICDAQPLFPQDILNILGALETPRILVSTPVHLRSMVMSGLSFPSVSRVLCATAPLAQALAADVEDVFGGTLAEVYGCSEVGSMACRTTSESDVWTLFSGITFDLIDGQTNASAAHLPVSVVLSDKLTMLAPNTFQLLGRSEDMIEIGGKRGSLLEMNKILLAMPSIVDGAVFIPDNNAGLNRVASIIVLAAGTCKSDVLDGFRAVLDPVFIPRPLYIVEALPREESGKLSRKKLLSLYEACKKKNLKR